MTTVDYTRTYDPDTDFDARFTLATARRIAEALGPGDRVLELGCATGLMSSALVGNGRRLVGVDRSEPYLRRARERALPGATFVAGDLDDLPDLERFDHVVLTNVLHEVQDPVGVLRRVRERHLSADGRVHASLQNPFSLHRLVALEMGLIEQLGDLSERGRRYGTSRLYTADELAALGRDAGLVELRREGVFLKPLPNAAMAALDDAVLDGFERAARHLPGHAAVNLVTFGHGR